MMREEVAGYRSSSVSTPTFDLLGPCRYCMWRRGTSQTRIPDTAEQVSIIVPWNGRYYSFFLPSRQKDQIH